jgi:predicted transcriptional regulator
MKIAITIPDEVFALAERLAKQTRRSRSQLYSDAIREYVARHAPDEITDAMNRICDEAASESNGFARAAARKTLAWIEW